MPEDFASRVIAAHQAGLAEARQQKQLEQQQEDRDLQRQILKHSIDRLKIEDALQTRSIQAQNAQLMQGQPATSTSEAVGDPSQTQSRPIYNPLPAQEISGVPATATSPVIPGITVHPQSMQDILEANRRAEMQKALVEAQFKPTTTPEGGTTTFGIPGLTSTQSVVGKPKEPTTDFGKYYLPAYAGKLGKTVDQLSPQEGIDALTEFSKRSQDPEIRDLMETQKRNQILLQQMQLAQQPTKEQATDTAKDIVAHRIAPEQLSQLFGGFGVAGQTFKRMVLGEAKKLDPNFDFEQASAEYQLTKSPTFQTNIRYMDSVQSSIPQVIDRANKLANGGVKSITALINAGKSQLNNVDLKKFQTDALLVGDEIAKILQGGGTGSGTSDAKLNQAAQIIGQNDSPAAIAGALADVKDLIGYRRKALTKGTYLENAGLGAPTEFVRDANGKIVPKPQ